MSIKLLFMSSGYEFTLNIFGHNNFTATNVSLGPQIKSAPFYTQSPYDGSMFVYAADNYGVWNGV